MNNDNYDSIKNAISLLRHHFNLNCSEKYVDLNKKIQQYFQGERQDTCVAGIQLLLHTTYEKFKYPVIHDFLCGKQLKPNKDHQRICYSCETCRVEHNSIICAECYDIAKHQAKGHKIQKRTFDQGSFCDCGDTSKWNKDGFCSNHKYIAQKQYLTKDQQKEFQQLTIYFLMLLYGLYRCYLDQFLKKYADKKMIDYLKLKINIFGLNFFEELNDCNRNRERINRITSELLSKQICLQIQQENSQLNSEQNRYFCKQIKVSFINMLFSFTKFAETSSKCQMLIPLLFYNNESIRQFVTIQYIKNYQNFPNTPYRSLSCYLLSNSLMIADLAKRNILGKLVFYRKVNNEEDGKLNEKIQALYKAYVQYLTDNIFLTNLKDQCAYIYWRYFNDIGGFLQIGSYCQAFNSQEQLDIVNEKFYHIEQSFIFKMIRLLDKMFSMKQFDTSFFKTLISSLFKKITTPPKEKQQKNNLFFTYERLWTIAVYLFLLRSKESKFNQDYKAKNSDMKYQMNYEQQIQFGILYHILSPKNISQAGEKFRYLFQKILNYILISNPDLPKRQMFYGVYYDYNSLIFSIDAIFIKIIIKMMHYLSIKQQIKAKMKMKQIEKIENEQLSSNNKKIDGNYSSSFFGEAYKLIKHKLSHFRQSLFKTIKQLCQKKSNNKYKLQKQLEQNLSTLMHFISQLSQCIYSEVPDLVLATKFQKICRRKYYKDMYKKYYHNLLGSIKITKNECKNPLKGIEKSTFIELARYILFQQKQVLQEFIQQTKSPNSTILLKQKSKGRQVDYYSHMNSLYRRLIRVNKVQDFYEVYDFFKIPFQSQTKNMPFHLIQTFAFDLLAQLLKKLLLHQLIDRKNIKETQVSNLNKEVQDNKETQYQCYLMTKELWKMSIYSNIQKFKPFFLTLTAMSENRIQQNDKLISQDYLSEYFLRILPKKLEKQIMKFISTSQIKEIDDQQQRQAQVDEQFQNYKQQQDDQLLENITPSMLSRLKIKEDQSKQDPVKINVEFQKADKNCSGCYKKIEGSLQQKQDEKVHQLCYVEYSKVPFFFDIPEMSKVRYFSSCEHYFHIQCLPSIPKNGKCAKCPKCSSLFNFLMPSQEQLSYNFNDLTIDAIQCMFKSIEMAIFQDKKIIQDYYVKIIKSIVIYILMVSTKSIKNYNKSTFATYKSLIQILSKRYMLCQKSYQQKSRVRQGLFMLESNSKFLSLIKYLTQVLGQNIIQNVGFDSEGVQAVNLASKQANIIQAYLQYIFQKRILMKIPLNQQNQRQFIKKFNLPQNLKQLCLLRSHCDCKQTKSHPAISLCLLPHYSKQTFGSSCHLCNEKFITNHMPKHESQMLVIEVNTGVITYYSQFENTFWTSQIGSIYKDSMLKTISTQLPLKWEPFSNKQNYKLDYEEYEEIIFKFYSKQYRISGELKPFKQYPSLF